MAKKWWATLLLFGALASCGGPSVCECQAESQKENPDLELMEDCANMMEERSFEDTEAELARCK